MLKGFEAGWAAFTEGPTGFIPVGLTAGAAGGIMFCTGGFTTTGPAGFIVENDGFPAGAATFAAGPGGFGAIGARAVGGLASGAFPPLASQ
jgi:hypothetical protein